MRARVFAYVCLYVLNMKIFATLMLTQGHELCQRSILQIHAVQSQLGSPCCPVIFLSLIFPYRTSHSCYSTPSPFTQIQTNISVLHIPGVDFRTYSTMIELFLFQTNFLILTWVWDVLRWVCFSFGYSYSFSHPSNRAFLQFSLVIVTILSQAQNTPISSYLQEGGDIYMCVYIYMYG